MRGRFLVAAAAAALAPQAAAWPCDGRSSVMWWDNTA
jgi:hypothetical protein